tara:strand:+ start:406 stop:1482 length:1077 start_codon:yes stop_codon:yes gene_type:complete
MNLPKPKKINAEKYVAGLSLFKQKAAKIKLSANESALGPSPKAIKAFNKVAKNLKRYPDSDGVFLRNILAKKFKLDPQRIILGSGSDQVFELVCKTFLSKNDEVIVPEHSFIIYRIYSKIYGAKIKYAREINFRISIKSILSKVTKKTKIVFLANPNNPTGTIISKKELLELRKRLRNNILLVVDDAYCEYVKDKNYLPGMKLFSNSNNVIVTRTFSKIYGLAGLRIGWGYGPKNLMYALNQTKPPFNINRAALFAAAESIRDIKWLNKEIEHVNKWTKIFYNNFKKLGIETNFSYGNFLLVNFNKIKGNSKKLFLKLANNGILVRKMDVYRIKNSLRITIGNNFENKKFIKTLRKII